MDVGDSFRSKEVTPSGADVVAAELDELNDRYRNLIDVLYGRLQEIAKMNPNDIVTLVSGFFVYFFSPFIVGLVVFLYVHLTFLV